MALDFTQLVKRVREIENEANVTEARLADARAHLEELHQELQKKYGTSDVAELQAKLEGLQKEEHRLLSTLSRDIESLTKQVGE